MITNKLLMKKHLIFLLFISSCLFATTDISTLYKTIEPNSIYKHLVFYELYKDTKEGKKALRHAWKLISQNANTTKLNFPKINISNLIDMIIKAKPINPKISEEELEIIEKIGSSLKNRSLKTYNLLDEKTFINSDPEQIDLARAILVSQNKYTPLKIRYYESALDLIALQILAKLKKNPTPADKIKAINNFIFFEMGYRFPPTSKYANKINTYTSLSSVIDNKKGVCLGLSILYLCIAERLDLKLLAITPPGHIFLRYKDKNNEINIETTNRGIDIPSNHYLTIETKSLQIRDKKQVIGLAFINEASTHIKNKQYKESALLYEKASNYLKDDILLKNLTAYSYLFLKEDKKCFKILKETKNKISDYSITKDTMAEDILNKYADRKALKSIFTDFEDTRKSILKKKQELETITKKYPKFRNGFLFLSDVYMKLGKTKEALNTLLKYQKIDQSDPRVNFYISILSYQRFDFKNAWAYLKKTESIFNEKKYTPQHFIDFKKELTKTCLN